jgi:ATP-dependent RNA helicase DDX56/DBP9
MLTVTTVSVFHDACQQQVPALSAHPLRLLLLQALAVHIPRSAQCMLMSATSSAEVEQLQQLVLHNPVTLNLLTSAGPAAASGAAGSADAAAAAADGAAGFGDGGAGSAAEIRHFSYSCSRDDRRLVVLSLLKLGLLQKKVRFNLVT